MLGDVAIAVNPKDQRYKKFIGKRAFIPLIEKEIPIIGDSYVDMEFGTGCLKITPGHDFNDFEIGKKNKLPLINIMNADGTTNLNVPKRFQSLTMGEARKKILIDLKESGNLLKEKDHIITIPKKR
jgi:valyl-tRNA synthetase